MSFKILIVEDEPLYANQLELLIEKLNYQHLATVDNSTDALIHIQKVKPSLIIMDIHIQGEYDGIELASLIEKKDSIPIIFITSLKDDSTFARATRKNPINFLLKPFNEIQLQRCIELAVKQISKKPKSQYNNTPIDESHFFVKQKGVLKKIALKDVLFLEADGHYCQVHTKNKKHLIRLSLSKLIKRLDSNLFFQTHRSFIVNLTNIKSVDLNEGLVFFETKKALLSNKNHKSIIDKIKVI